MSTVDPYATPNAMGGNETAETYQPKVFSFSGRIGRLRYLAYSVAIQLVLLGAMLVVSLIGGLMSAVSTGLGTGITVLGMIVVVVVAMVYGFALAIRRINDFNSSGWLSLILFIPLIGIIMALVLLFMPGTNNSNNYGPAPAENSTGVIVGALALPVCMVVIGILAAISIPAYQEYALRAQAAQEMEFNTPD